MKNTRVSTYDAWNTTNEEEDKAEWKEKEGKTAAGGIEEKTEGDK